MCMSIYLSIYIYSVSFSAWRLSSTRNRKGEMGHIHIHIYIYMHLSIYPYLYLYLYLSLYIAFP